MFSIICVYNNKQILNEYLLNSLNTQTREYELILIDNSNQQFKSAAQALNFGSLGAKNEYLFFTHQDIQFTKKNFLKITEDFLNEIPNMGIVGVAGKIDHSGVLSNILHGSPPHFAGEIQIDKITRVEVIDECLIIIPKLIFDKLKFDEKVCDDWHLYAIDYCLSIKKMGYNAYILPISLYHRSSGYSLSESYYTTLNKVIKKHKDNISILYTPMGDWNTHISVRIQRSRFWNFFHFCLKKLI